MKARPLLRSVTVSSCHNCTLFLGTNRPPYLLGDTRGIQVAPYCTRYERLHAHMDAVRVASLVNLWDQPLVSRSAHMDAVRVASLANPETSPPGSFSPDPVWPLIANHPLPFPPHLLHFHLTLLSLWPLLANHVLIFPFPSFPPSFRHHAPPRYIRRPVDDPLWPECLRDFPALLRAPHHWCRNACL